MSELSTGVSIERQVELISDVVHNHSNDINKINGLLANDWAPWSKEVVDHINDNTESINSLMKRVSDLEDINTGHGVVRFLTLTAVGVGGWLLYKKYKKKDSELRQRVDDFFDSFKEQTVPKTDVCVDDIVD